jgi:hypothetical protein
MVQITNDAFLMFFPLLVGFYSINKHLNAKSTLNRCEILLNSILLIPFGLLVLIKGSLLVETLAITLVIVFFHIYIRNYTLAFISFLTPFISVVFFWVVAKQPIVEFINYIKYTIIISAGYTDAMSSFGNKNEVILFVLSSSFILLASLISNNEKSKLKRSLITLILLISLFVSFKSGFVRHDGHALIAAQMLVYATLLISTITTNSIKSILIAFGVGTYLFICINYVKINPDIFIKTIKINLYNVFSGVEITFHQGCNKDLLYNNKLNLISENSDLPFLKGSADTYSCQQSLLISKKADWKPRPVFQSYAAYTPDLIRLNKNYLDSNESPENIIFQVQSIDNRLPAQEDSESWLVLLKKYIPERIYSNFILLKKCKDCNIINVKNALIETHSINEVITFPQFNCPVFLKIDFVKNKFGKLLTLFYKPSQLWIHLELENGNCSDFRIIPGMIKSGALISPLIEENKQFLLLYLDYKWLNNRTVKSYYIYSKNGISSWLHSFKVTYQPFELQKHPELTSMINSSKIELIPKSKKLFDAVGCDACFDTTNLISSESAGHLLDKILTVNGWMAISLNKGIPPKSIYLIITNSNSEKFIINSQAVKRPDLGKVFNHPELTDCGFQAEIDVSQLSGPCIIQIAYYENDKLYIIKNVNKEIAL